MSLICDFGRTTIPDFSRGYCSGWADENATITFECVARSGAGITLFEIFDDEQDGDLDAIDFAWFQQTYESIPKQVQSNAKVVSVECCIPESVIRDIGECLSGPSQSAIPSACIHDTRCVVGFSEPVEIGDYLFKLCAAGLAVTPDLSNGLCTSWQDPATPSAFECVALRTPGLSLFVVSDDDGDGDVDLRDFSVFQRDFGLP